MPHALCAVRRRYHAAGGFALYHDGARRRGWTREHDGLDDVLARRGYLEQLGEDLLVRQPDQRGRDFGLLVELVRQVLRGGNRLLKRRRVVADAPGTIFQA